MVKKTTYANTSQNNPKSFKKTSLQKTISQKQTRIAAWVFIPLQIKSTSVILNTIGATRTMRWLTALQA